MPKKKHSDKIYKIRVQRSSVCMADDVNAPNTEEIPYRADETLSEFFVKIIGYIPKVTDSEWLILSSANHEVGYIKFGINGSYTFTPTNKSRDIYVYELGGNIFCRKI